LDNEKCILDCTKAIDLDPTFVKPLLRRAESYENTDKLDEALADYKKLCELEVKNSSYKSKCYVSPLKIGFCNKI
jgi:tetratricopeptide (TPR) repeat protein